MDAGNLRVSSMKANKLQVSSSKLEEARSVHPMYENYDSYITLYDLPTSLHISQQCAGGQHSQKSAPQSQLQAS